MSSLTNTNGHIILHFFVLMPEISAENYTVVYVIIQCRCCFLKSYERVIKQNRNVLLMPHWLSQLLDKIVQDVFNMLNPNFLPVQ